ncbi:GGDEF domain-containing protein [Inhella sp.]|uniref:GGDEF domain-containing protein n=1 Tax=Inhella sp. TaxID=1921806 RepID=UPI0035B36B27
MRAWNQLAARLLALPRGAAEFAIVAVSVGGSQVATLLALQLLLPAVMSWKVPLLIAFFVPLMVSWPVAVVLMRLLREVEAARVASAVQASTDALTGLLNRRRWLELAHREWQRAHTDGEPLAVLLLDVDNFKAINDAHGHATGDQVLQNLARTVEQSLRPGDAVGRWGGEEFVALLPRAALASALQAAERVRQAVQASPMTLNGQTLEVTVSIGVAVGRSDARAESQTAVEPSSGPTALQRLLQRADTAMYLAKTSGKNRSRAA